LKPDYLHTFKQRGGPRTL